VSVDVVPKKLWACYGPWHKTPAKTFAVLAYGYFNVAIGNPERHMRKASHCGSKQQ